MISSVEASLCFIPITNPPRVIITLLLYSFFLNFVEV